MFDLPVKPAAVWHCCGGLSSDEEPSYLSLYENDELKAHVIDGGCNSLPVRFVMLTDDTPPYLPARIEAHDSRVASRLVEILDRLGVEARANPFSCSPDRSMRHLKRVHCGLLSRAISRDVPPAALLRLLPALTALQSDLAWRRLHAPLRMTVENLAEQPLRVSFLSTSDEVRVDVQGARKADSLRLRSRRFEYLGITTDWMLPSGHQGRVQRRHVNTLCGLAEVLIALGADGIPEAPRRLMLGNWLKMPREVSVAA